jgi:hypothetical protein
MTEECKYRDNYERTHESLGQPTYSVRYGKIPITYTLEWIENSR